MTNATFIFLLFVSFSSFAQQQETFDLASYTVPDAWKKMSNTKDVIGYVIVNNQKGTYCQIGIYASTNSRGSLSADFESEWQVLIVKSYKPTKAPELTPATSDKGWSIQVGAAPFDFSGAQSAAMLVTMSGFGRCMSISVLTNTDEYQGEIEKFLVSVDLKKPDTDTQPVTNAGHDSSILGTWGANASDQSSWRVNNGVMSTISRQYTFNGNGTYSFITKTFDPLMDKLLLGKENGTYQMSADNITIIPQKSVLEAWSKKDGTDKWGKFLTTQNITLEKTTYRFTKHYFEGSKEWSLVLQGDRETRRDGPFSGNTTFTNAWYYGPISANNTQIKLPD